MRLGDLDALLEQLPVHPDGGLRSVKEEMLMIRVREDIRNAPTIDAVPVVRCKDCKHGQPMVYRHTESPCIMCSHLGSGFFARVFNPNWFCADGERRSE